MANFVKDHPRAKPHKYISDIEFSKTLIDTDFKKRSFLPNNFYVKFELQKFTFRSFVTENVVRLKCIFVTRWGYRTRLHLV